MQSYNILFRYYLNRYSDIILGLFWVYFGKIQIIPTLLPQLTTML
jgi:hypothetical protein